MIQSYFKDFRNVGYRNSSSSIFLMFASQAIWWSFFQLWLTSPKSGLSLSAGAVGTIFAVNSAVTLILMFVYGTIQDRLNLKNYLLIFCAILISLVGPFFTWVYGPLLQHFFTLGIIVGAIYLPAAFLGTAPLTETYAEKASRKFGFEYGKARAWGSLGYAVATLIAGFLFVINPLLNFWAGSILGIVFLITLLISRTNKHSDDVEVIIADDSTVPRLKDVITVAKLPALWVMIFLTMFTWTFYTVFDQQMFPQFYTSLFSTAEQGEKMYGILNSVQVFFEAVMMGVIPFIMRKIGVRQTLIIGMLVMSIRIGACSLTNDPVAVSFIKMLHSIEVPLFMLPIFRYFTLHFDTRLSATLYMVGFQVAAQVGQVILSTPLGMLKDAYGHSVTFIVISVIVLIATVVASFLLKKDEEDVYGQPLITT